MKIKLIGASILLVFCLVSINFSFLASDLCSASETEIFVNPEISVDKKIWNPASSKFVDGPLDINYEDLGTPAQLEFQINVSNTGDVDLLNPKVTDILPDFLEFDHQSANVNFLTFYQDGQNLTWTWLDQLLTEDDIIISLIVNVTSGPDEAITGTNYVNVTVDEDAEDEDTIDISISVETVEFLSVLDKKVKDPLTDEWVDELPYIKGCEPVRFRINITYYGSLRMKYLLVFDQLPYQYLEFDDNVYIEIAGQEITTNDVDYYPDIYLEGDTFIRCNNQVVIPEGGVYFSWINQSIGPQGGLEYGDSVIIEFDASVIEYCENSNCENTENCAESWIWSSCGEVYHARDCVNVTCIANPGDFSKTVSLNQPTDWQEEVHTVQGHEIKFKLELTYYGNMNLTNISFLDTLPCCLEYKETIESPSLTEITVSADKQIIWWNVTKEVADCETISIIFRANVIAPSECGNGCINDAYVYGYINGLTSSLVVEGEDNASIIADPNTPPEVPDVSGPSEGIAGVSYSFKTTLLDNDGDQIYYKFDWGDGITNWMGPVNSGEVTEPHTYSSTGSYEIKVKAKDIHGAESTGPNNGWTQYPLTIVIKEASINVSFKIFNIERVEAIVTNTGDADLTNLQYEFNISRDRLFNFRDLNINGEGDIASLPSGGETNITSESLGYFTFGLADVTVTITKTGVIDPASATGRLLMIGPILLVIPEFNIF